MTASMQAWETLGCVAHPGGTLIAGPLLSVGVVQAVSRTSGLQLELVARRPVDHRTATRRQADIRDGTGVTPAPRVLLPPHDEGTKLRVGWLDETAGRAQWVHPAAYESSSGGHAGGEVGPTDLLTYLLPPLFDRVELVFAWPEIGFAEQVVPMLLPDRAAAERASVSVWDAPPARSQPPSWTQQSSVSVHAGRARPEDGTQVTAPHVLWRSDHAVVVLTRLTRHERGWQLELIGYARDTRADIAMTSAAAARHARSTTDTVAHGGLTAGVVGGDTVHWDRHPSGQSTGGPGVYETTRSSTLPAPDDGTAAGVRLAVRWPAVGMADTEFLLHAADLF